MAKGRKRVRHSAPKPTASQKNPSKEHSHHVSWCFHKLDLEYPPGGGNQISGDYAIKLFEFLGQLEKQRVKDVRSGRIHGYQPKIFSYQKIENMPEPYKSRVERRLEALKLDDLQGFLRMRFGSVLRAYAIPPDEGNMSYILWLDPRHQLWPSRENRKASGN